MNTEAQRRANKAHDDRLKASGGAKITLRLSAGAMKRLGELVAIHGSREKAIEALLREKPVQAAPKVQATLPAGKSGKAAGGAPVAAGKPIGFDHDGNPIFKR